MLLTFGGAGVFWIIDLFLVASGRLSYKTRTVSTQDSASNPTSSPVDDNQSEIRVSEDNAAPEAKADRQSDKILEAVTVKELPEAFSFDVPDRWRQSVDDMDFMKLWNKHVLDGGSLIVFLYGFIALMGGTFLPFYLLPILGVDVAGLLTIISSGLAALLGLVLPSSISTALSGLISFISLPILGIGTLLIGPSTAEWSYRKYIKFRAVKLECPSCKSKNLRLIKGQAVNKSASFTTKSGAADKRFKDNFMTGQFVGLWQCDCCENMSKTVHWRTYTMNESSRIASIELLNAHD
jgi:hypothetical protein